MTSKKIVSVMTQIFDICEFCVTFEAKKHWRNTKMPIDVDWRKAKPPNPDVEEKRQLELKVRREKICNEKREQYAAFLRKKKGKGFTVYEIIKACGAVPSCMISCGPYRSNCNGNERFTTEELLDSMAGGVNVHEENIKYRHPNIDIEYRYEGGASHTHYYCWKE